MNIRIFLHEWKLLMTIHDSQQKQESKMARFTARDQHLVFFIV